MNFKWLKIVIKLLPELKIMFIKSVCFVVLIELIKIIPPYSLKIALDLLIETNPNFTLVSLSILCVLIASIITTFIEEKYTNFMSNNVFHTETEILKKSHKKLLELDLNFHENNPSGDNVQLLNKGSSRLADLSWFVNDQFLGAIFQIILTIIILIFCNYKVALLFTIFIPISIYTIYSSSKSLQKYRQRYHSKFREANWSMTQSLMNIRTVKDYSREYEEHKKYSFLLRFYKKLALLRIKKETKDVIIRDSVLSLARVSVLFSCVYLVFNKEMSPGTFLLFATLSEKAIASMFRLGRLYNFLGDSIESIEEFARIFSESSLVKDSENSINKNIKGNIEFLNVSFDYSKNNEILQNISFKVPEKSITAVVGKSGAGKSTLIKLLMRHYDVSSGEILIDNINIKDYKLKNLREDIAIVSQDIEIFDTTIAKNIAYGTNSSFKDITNAAKLANAHEFIENFKNQYETTVGERGLKLSGGQKQRIGIARALIKKPAILIFDEATSSLDTESELSIQNSIQNISHMQTMVIIAHRLSTIKNADNIIVMENGEIVEQGGHKVLIEKKGTFYGMVNLQGV